MLMVYLKMGNGQKFLLLVLYDYFLVRIKIVVKQLYSIMFYLKMLMEKYNFFYFSGL